MMGMHLPRQLASSSQTPLGYTTLLETHPSGALTGTRNTITRISFKRTLPDLPRGKGLCIAEARSTPAQGALALHIGYRMKRRISTLVSEWLWMRIERWMPVLSRVPCSRLPFPMSMPAVRQRHVHADDA